MTTGDTSVDPVGAVAAARAGGAAEADPVGFCVIEAMARRAALQQGVAREQMAARIDALLARQGARPRPEPVCGQQAGALAGLVELVDRLGRGLPAVGPAGPAARPVPLSHSTAPQPLKSVVAFQGTWSRLRVEQRLRQALAQVPASAGPLNSSHLVNRALETMRDVSPGYLDAFMSHVDTLQWLEQASGAGELRPRPGPPRATRKG